MKNTVHIKESAPDPVRADGTSENAYMAVHAARSLSSEMAPLLSGLSLWVENTFHPHRSRRSQPVQK